MLPARTYPIASFPTEDFWHVAMLIDAPVPPRAMLADPQQLLTWLGPDRAAMKFTSLDDVRTKRSAVQAVIRQWMEYV